MRHRLFSPVSILAALAMAAGAATMPTPASVAPTPDAGPPVGHAPRGRRDHPAQYPAKVRALDAAQLRARVPTETKYIEPHRVHIK